MISTFLQFATTDERILLMTTVDLQKARIVVHDCTVAEVVLDVPVHKRRITHIAVVIQPLEVAAVKVLCSGPNS